MSGTASRSITFARWSVTLSRSGRSNQTIAFLPRRSGLMSEGTQQSGTQSIHWIQVRHRDAANSIQLVDLANIQKAATVIVAPPFCQPQRNRSHICLRATAIAIILAQREFLAQIANSLGRSDLYPLFAGQLNSRACKVTLARFSIGRRLAFLFSAMNPRTRAAVEDIGQSGGEYSCQTSAT